MSRILTHYARSFLAAVGWHLARKFSRPAVLARRCQRMLASLQL